MRVGEALADARARLCAAGIEDYDADAAWLMCHLLGCERGALLPKYPCELPAGDAADYERMVIRRMGREPVQRITGCAYFMGMRFLTDPAALIPRMDTETLCHAALDLARLRGYRTALDLCCGSGVLAVSLNKLGGLSVTASDISPDCISLTQKNAGLLGAAVDTRTGDLFGPLSGLRFDMIVCNPPYVADGERLMAEVALYDPRTALYAGPDGMDFYRRLANDAGGHMNRGGALLMEAGIGQAKAVAALFGGAAAITKDINGIDRVIQIDY